MSVTRAEYRESKKPTSVCVYTIAQESRYIIIENIPVYGSIEEFIKHVGQFGHVTEYRMLDTHATSTNDFNVMMIQYQDISQARYAKRKLDDKPYQYHPLRVNYAPEYETPDDIRLKFQDRYQSIYKRLNHSQNKKEKRQEEEEEEEVYGPLERQFQSFPLIVKKRRRI